MGANGAGVGAEVGVRQARPAHGTVPQRRPAPGYRLLVVMDGTVVLDLDGESCTLSGGDALTVPGAVSSVVHSPSDDCWLFDVTAP